MVFVGRGLTMRNGLLTSMGLTGLLATSFVPGAVAAPVVPPAIPTAVHGPSLEQVYYYHGRYYPYHYIIDIICIEFIAMGVGIIIDKAYDQHEEFHRQRGRSLA